MENKRVLIPVTHPVGGIRTYLLYNLKRLHEEGYRFTFLARSGEAFNIVKKDVAMWERTDFIDISGKGIRGIWRAVRLALKTQQFDLIHSQGLQIGTITAAVNFFRRIPHLITLHDVIVPKFNDLGRFQWLKKTVTAFVTRRASCIIPVSHDCEENHLECFPSWRKGPVQVKPILNGIDVTRLKSSRSQFEAKPQPNLREQFGIGNNIILGGFFGRFMPQKAFDVVLKALALLDQRGYGDRFRMIVTTDGTGYLNETLRDTAANPNVAKMVNFMQAVPNITPLLLQTDVLIMPSRWEACPLLPMEALILGTPVIGSNCLGLREVLAGTPSAVVPTDNAEALADAMIAFIEKPEPVKNAAKKYAAEADKRFDVNAAADKLLKIYQSFAPL